MRPGPALRGTLGLHGAQAVGNRLGVEHHAAAAAVGVVVGLLLLVFRIVADLVAVRLKQIFGAGAAQDAGREKAVAQLRKKALQCQCASVQSSSPLTASVNMPSMGVTRIFARIDVDIF